MLSDRRRASASRWRAQTAAADPGGSALVYPLLLPHLFRSTRAGLLQYEAEHAAFQISPIHTTRTMKRTSVQAATPCSPPWLSRRARRSPQLKEECQSAVHWPLKGRGML